MVRILLVSLFCLLSCTSYLHAQRLVAFEYWYDDAYVNRLTVQIPPDAQRFFVDDSIAIPQLNDGFHYFHSRFVDNRGQWSSITSDLLYIQRQDTLLDTLITAYRYWFNNSDPIIVPLDTPKVRALIDVELDTIGQNLLPELNYLHVQFLDASNRWSSIVSDSFINIDRPTASFQTPDSTVCTGFVVPFRFTGKYADQFFWDFGDGGTSTERHPSHRYLRPGQYTVRLRVINSYRETVDSVIRTEYIQVARGVVSAFSPTSDTLSCTGVLLQAQVSEPGIQYRWLQGTTVVSTRNDPFFFAKETGNYRLVIENIERCIDTSARSLDLWVPSIQLNPFTTDTLICKGASIELSLLSTDLPYTITQYQFQWLKDGQVVLEGNSIPTYTVDQPGRYVLRLTDQVETCVVESPVIHVRRFEVLLNPPRDSLLCVGDTIFISSNWEQENFSYQWFLNDTLIPGATEPRLMATDTGRYRLTIYNPDIDCLAESEWLHLYQKPVIHRLGNLLELRQRYSSIQWFADGIPIPNADQHRLRTHFNAVYQVRVVSACGDTLLSEPFGYRYINRPDDDSEHHSQWLLYPNPAQEMFCLQTNGIGVPFQGKCVLFDRTGSIVAEYRSDNGISTQNCWNLPKLANGVYIVALTDDIQTVYHPLMISD